MQFRPNRKGAALARLGRLCLVAAAMGAACSFPDYTFEANSPTSCDNGVQDGDETGPDCGGSCGSCGQCDDDSMCDGLSCVANVCVDCAEANCEPACDDFVLNGDETAVDCGGSCPDKCTTNQPCMEDSDCVDNVCDEVCLEASCTDMVRNGNESDVDCGRACDTLCDEGQTCEVNQDCESGACAETVCAPPHCTNDELDAEEGETDTDCGGDANACPRCGVGALCAVDSDCAEGVCEDEICADASCDDAVANGDESDRDCGGPTACERCQPGQACQLAGDCASGVCTDNICQEHSCEDDVLNGSESDVDCGGDCPSCGDNEICHVGADCESTVCEASVEDSSVNRCAPPRCDDGVSNGGELGVDCGGGSCDLCSPGEGCTENAACASYLCEQQRCAQGLSLNYECGQCGQDSVADMISYRLTLTNLTDDEIDVGGLVFRYFLSAEANGGLGFDCQYNGSMSCGADPTMTDSGIENSEATHYIEATLGNTVAPIEAGGSAEVFIQVTLGGNSMVQNNDYSFNKEIQPGYLRIPVFREGQLIWGMVPPAN